MSPASHPPPPSHERRSSRRRSSASWVWLAYLATPLLFGVMVKVFPLDNAKAGLAVVVSLCLVALVGVLSRGLARAIVAFGGAVVMAAVVFYLPFWALRASDRAVGDARPVYSFRDAKANPDAFAKWWNLFVEEVVRTNAIVFERDPEGTRFQGELPYRPRPGASVEFYKGRIVINNRGYRGDDIPTSKGDDYRILTIGDSATFGQTLFPESRTWSAILQDLIGRELQCARPVKVINGGVNGFRLHDAIDRIGRDHAWLKPDMVLSYFGWNTMIDLGIDPPNVAPPAPPTPNERLQVVRWYAERAVASLVNEVRSRSPTVIAEMLGTTRSSKDVGRAALLAKARAGRLHADYLELIEQSRRLGHTLVFLSFNTAATPDSPEDAKRFYQSVTHAFRSLLTQIDIHNEMVRELAAETATAYVDTSANLHGRYDDDLYLDIVHFTPKGDLAMARNVFRGIRPMLLADARLRCRPR